MSEPWEDFADENASVAVAEPGPESTAFATQPPWVDFQPPEQQARRQDLVQQMEEAEPGLIDRAALAATIGIGGAAEGLREAIVNVPNIPALVGQVVAPKLFPPGMELPFEWGKVPFALQEQQEIAPQPGEVEETVPALDVIGRGLVERGRAALRPGEALVGRKVPVRPPIPVEEERERGLEAASAVVGAKYAAYDLLRFFATPEGLTTLAASPYQFARALIGAGFATEMASQVAEAAWQAGEMEANARTPEEKAQAKRAKLSLFLNVIFPGLFAGAAFKAGETRPGRIGPIEMPDTEAGMRRELDFQKARAQQKTQIEAEAEASAAEESLIKQVREAKTAGQPVPLTENQIRSMYDRLRRAMEFNQLSEQRPDVVYRSAVPAPPQPGVMPPPPERIRQRPTVTPPQPPGGPSAIQPSPEGPVPGVPTQPVQNVGTVPRPEVPPPVPAGGGGEARPPGTAPRAPRPEPPGGPEVTGPPEGPGPAPAPAPVKPKPTPPAPGAPAKQLRPPPEGAFEEVEGFPAVGEKPAVRWFIIKKGEYQSALKSGPSGLHKPGMGVSDEQMRMLGFEPPPPPKEGTVLRTAEEVSQEVEAARAKPEPPAAPPAPREPEAQFMTFPESSWTPDFLRKLVASGKRGEVIAQAQHWITSLKLKGKVDANTTEATLYKRIREILKAKKDHGLVPGAKAEPAPPVKETPPTVTPAAPSRTAQADRDWVETLDQFSPGERENIARTLESASPENAAKWKAEWAEANAARKRYLEGGEPELVEVPSGTPGSVTEPAKWPVVEFPVDKIEVDPKLVPQFKEAADPKTGVVAGERLEADTFVRPANPILVWELKNGRHVIITGRHRLDLARRVGEKTIPTYIVKESEGWTAQKAMTWDAETNIRDGKGSVNDYTIYFEGTEIAEREAKARGLLGDAKSKAGWALAKLATDDLKALYRSGRVTEDQAVAIAETGRDNPELQRIGIKYALRDKSPNFIRNLMQAVTVEQVQRGRQMKQAVLFGDDEAAMNEMEVRADRAQELIDEVRDQINAVRGAAKRPEVARNMGVDVKDPEAINRKLIELRAEDARWKNWALHPDLVARVIGKKPPSEPPPAPPPPPPEPPAQAPAPVPKPPEPPAAPAPKPAAKPLSAAEQKRLALQGKKLRDRQAAGEELSVEERDQLRRIEEAAGQTDLLDIPDSGVKQRIAELRKKADELDRLRVATQERMFGSVGRRKELAAEAKQYEAAAAKARADADFLEYRSSPKKPPTSDTGDLFTGPGAESVQDAVRREQADARRAGPRPPEEEPPGTTEAAAPPEERIRAAVRKKDVMPFRDFLASPEFAFRKIPEAAKYVTRLIEAVLGFKAKASRSNEALVKNGWDKLSYADQVRTTKALRDVYAGNLDAVRNLPPELRAVAERTRAYFDLMRERIIEIKTQDLLDSLPEARRGALEAIRDEGMLPEEAFKQFKLREAGRRAVMEALEELQDLRNWGLDNYVTNIELGSYRVLDEAGGILAIAETQTAAKAKALKYLEDNPGYRGELILDDSYSGPLDVPTKLSQASYFRTITKLSRQLGVSSKNIQEALRREGHPAIVVKPTSKYARPLQHRRGVLAGEATLADSLPAYIFAIEKKLALDPLLKEARNLLPRLPRNTSRQLEALIDQTKGTKSVSDEITDYMLSPLGRRPFAATRGVNMLRDIATNLKLGYRPVAALINRLGGLHSTLTKATGRPTGPVSVENAPYVGSKNGLHWWLEGRKLKRSAEWTEIWDRNKDFVGWESTQSSVEGATHPGGKLLHPLGLFQLAERWNRPEAFATFYTQGREAMRMSGPEAEAYARWMTRFTQNIYDPVALPRSMRGPAGRLSFQFKPYLVKHLEMLSTLRGPQIPVYLAGFLAMGGPRAVIFMLRSLPFIGNLWLLRESEDQLNRKAPAASRGIGGALGVDVTAAVTPQLPTRAEDWIGPVLSDIYRLGRDVVGPAITGEKKDWSDLAEWGSRLAPVAFYWRQMVDSALADQGWTEDKRGRLRYQPTSADRFKYLMGAKPLQQSIEEVESRYLRETEAIFKKNRTGAIDDFLDALDKADTAEIERQRDNLYHYGVTQEMLENAAAQRTRTPRERLYRSLSRETRRREAERFVEE